MTLPVLILPSDTVYDHPISDMPSASTGHKTESG
jgi:hypothetical protein